MLSLHLGDVTELKILYKLAGESTYREILTTSTSCSVKASNNRPHEEDDNNSGDGGPPAKKQDRKEGVHLVDSDDEDEIVMGPKKSIFDDAKNLQIAATIDANTQFLAGWIQSAKKAVKEGRSLKTVCGSKKWIEKADAKVQYLKEKLPEAHAQYESYILEQMEKDSVLANIKSGKMAVVKMFSRLCFPYYARQMLLTVAGSNDELNKYLPEMLHSLV